MGIVYNSLSLADFGSRKNHRLIPIGHGGPGRLEEYVYFLLHYQMQFPEEYAVSAGYYDSDIIVWLVSVGRADEVKDFIGRFISDPIEFCRLGRTVRIHPSVFCLLGIQS